MMGQDPWRSYFDPVEPKPREPKGRQHPAKSEYEQHVERAVREGQFGTDRIGFGVFIFLGGIAWYAALGISTALGYQATASTIAAIGVLSLISLVMIPLWPIYGIMAIKDGMKTSGHGVMANPTGNGTIVTDEWGKHWYNELGHLHREDGPAVEYASGTKEWWVNGVRHRDGGPAIEHSCGQETYITHGYYHTTIYSDGRVQQWKR